MDKIINVSENGIYQEDLNKKSVPRLRVILTDNQLEVLKCIYYETKPIDQGTIIAILSNKMSQNTVISAIKLFLRNGLIKRYRGELLDGKVAHTYTDIRYKFYKLTTEGEEEYENQVKIMPEK